jgi:hypothetical protein
MIATKANANAISARTPPKHHQPNHRPPRRRHSLHSLSSRDQRFSLQFSPPPSKTITRTIHQQPPHTSWPILQTTKAPATAISPKPTKRPHHRGLGHPPRPKRPLLTPHPLIHPNNSLHNPDNAPHNYFIATLRSQYTYFLHYPTAVASINTLFDIAYPSAV